MPNPQRLGSYAKYDYVRYAKGQFSIAPLGLISFLSRMQVGRNAWPVMLCLCQQVFEDGSLGMRSRESIARDTGLTEAQVSRGMADLKEHLVIEPTIRWTGQGARVRDRSNFGHVARYRFTKEAWSFIEENLGS